MDNTLWFVWFEIPLTSDAQLLSCQIPHLRPYPIVTRIDAAVKIVVRTDLAVGSRVQAGQFDKSPALGYTSFNVQQSICVLSLNLLVL
jgi:hypothetical protein